MMESKRIRFCYGFGNVILFVTVLILASVADAGMVFIANFDDGEASGDARYTANYVANGLNDQGVPGYAPSAPGLTINGMFGTRGLDLRPGSNAVQYKIDAGGSYDPTVFNRAEGSIEFWVKPNSWTLDDASTHKMATISLTGGASGTVNYSLTKKSDGTIAFGITGLVSNGSYIGEITANDTSAFDSTGFNYITATWKHTGSADLYFNGILVARADNIWLSSRNDVATGSRYFLGMDSSGVSNNLSGILDAFVIRTDQYYDSTGKNIGDQVFSVPTSEFVPEPTVVSLVIFAGIPMLMNRKK